MPLSVPVEYRVTDWWVFLAWESRPRIIAPDAVWVIEPEVFAADLRIIRVLPKHFFRPCFDVAKVRVCDVLMMVKTNLKWPSGYDPGCRLGVVTEIDLHHMAVAAVDTLGQASEVKRRLREKRAVHVPEPADVKPAYRPIPQE